MTLFMTELHARDLDRVADWYAETLGLRVVLRDEPNGFVLLEAPGGGRVSLKRGEGGGRGAPGCRLVFRVDDLDSERSRLIGLGVPAGEVAENAEERYREVRLSDPEGTPITLFAWERS